MIKLNILFPLFNEYITAERTVYKRGNKKFYKGAKLRKEMKSLVTQQLLLKYRNVKFDSPMKMTFTWLVVDKGRDLDNMSYAKKFCLDSMQDIGMIKNDNLNNITEFTDKFRIVKKSDVGVEIEVYDG